MLSLFGAPRDNRIPRIFLALLILILPLSGAAQVLSGPFQGKNLYECLNKLSEAGGGWCEIRALQDHPSISSVWPENLDKKTRMTTGPKSVLIAWNGAAYDKKRKILYFFGGGHADYGGNEVYAFALETGVWKRLTDPSPLDHLYSLSSKKKGGIETRYCWIPDVRKVPGVAHTYDGIQFSQSTNTFFVSIYGAANGKCFTPTDIQMDTYSSLLLGERQVSAAIYEFNPSETQTNNGLEPLHWRRHELPFKPSYPRMLEYPDGSMLIGPKNQMYEFDPISGKTGKKVFGEADYGDGLAQYHPSGNFLLVSGDAFRIYNPLTKQKKVIGMPQNHGKSIAIGKDSRVYSWNGRGQILALDPIVDSPQWMLYDWGNQGPQRGDSRVYSKWQYLEKEDVFVGLSSHETGVWVYKHPVKLEGTLLSSISLQNIIKQATPGSTVTLPPGTYGQGLFINKSLRVRMEGVNLLGVARQRAVISVKCDDCDVTLEDFTTYGPAAGCISGNCAGIKMEGINPRLTIKNAHINNSVMGVLTDNRGGILRIEDSLIENTGLNDSSKTLGHGVYAGLIDELHIENTTIRNVNGDGHIVKSRAKLTEIQHSQLLGEHGFHSRMLDLPCGGKLIIRDATLQQGSNTDNSDLISMGTEPQNCKQVTTPDVQISGNTIIIDRDHSPDERAHNYGPNAFFNWQSPLGKLLVRENTIVNLETWSYIGSDKNIHLPDQSAGNKMCKTRGSCGLPPYKED